MSDPRDEGGRGLERPSSIPRLLRDPHSLEKPLDLKDLFGAEPAGTAARPEIADITTPFGSLGVFPSQSHRSGEAGPAGTGYGEIKLEPSVQDQEPELDSETGNEPEEGVVSHSVPSYMSALGLGADSGLQIDSAFGSLQEREPGAEEGSPDIAKKLPNIFGFGSS